MPNTLAAFTSPNLRLHAGALGAVFIIVITILIRAPFLNYIVAFGDEGIFLQGATRILNGERLYVEFFEFLPPGGFMLTAGWLAITDGSFIAARVLVIGVLVGIGCLVYAACLRVTQNIALSIGATLVWTAFTQGEVAQFLHNWFTSLFCMITFVALLAWTRKPGGRLWLVVLAGLAGGMAAMITQNRGALVLLAGLAAFRYPGDVRAVALYCVAAIFVPALLIAQLAHQGTLQAAFDSVIMFPLKHYAGINYLPPGPNLLAFLVAGAFALLLVYREGRHILIDRAFRLCAGFCLAALLGLLARADRDHLGYALPLVLPLLLMAACRLTSPRLHLLLAGILAGSAFLNLNTFETMSRMWRLFQEPMIATHRGPVRVTPGATAEIAALVRHLESLPQEDAVFVYPYSPLLPFLTSRRHSAEINVIIPGYTTKEQYVEACRDVLRGARWLVTDDRWTSAEWTNMFPAIAEPAPPERMLFEAILEEASVPAGAYGIHSLRLIVNADASKCDVIAASSAS
jgi:hypothetical protein